jgi:hypothetical protein
VTVTDPKQAALLSDLESAVYFEPFLARERTASQAAAELGCRLDTLLYRVRTFLAAGLLVVTRLEPRAGRPVKHYRSSADAYLIPFGVTPYADLEERIRELLHADEDAVVRGLARVLRSSHQDGQRLYRTARGEVFRQSADALGRGLPLDDPAALEHYTRQGGTVVGERLNVTLYLSDSAARALLAQFYSLWQRHGRTPDPEAATKPFYFSFVLFELAP